MLTNFVKKVKYRQSDILLTIGIILIALISFGAGRLTADSTDKEPIIIQNPENSYSASVYQSVKEQSDEKQIEQGTFVASKNSNKYHWPNCSAAKRISSENQVWFSSETEAQSTGYVRCSNFEKYIP